jgi:hypothetical protein
MAPTCASRPSGWTLDFRGAPWARRTLDALPFVMRLAIGAVIVVLAGCVALPDRIAFELRPPAAQEPQAFGSEVVAAVTPAPAARARRELDSRALPFGHGEIIVSESGGAMSLFYSLFAADYAPWVHAGIVAIEDGQAVVYEANGDFVPVPGLAPTTTIKGAVRRIGAAEFVRGKWIVGLYRLPPQVDRERLVAFAREQYLRATPFDAYFDSDDASALYCTELVALALAQAGMAPIEASATSDNASVGLARDWLRLRSHRVYLAGQLVAPMQEIGRWSADLRPAQIDAYFAVKRELHRRFDADARLGHLFVWSSAGLRLRDSVRRFYSAAMGAADPATGSDGRAATEQRVRLLAHEHFDAGSKTAAPAEDFRVVASPGNNQRMAR